MTLQSTTSAWKKKYLALLDRQEALEARLNTQNNLLKRALFRSSLAAEGNDEYLDRQLQSLRKLLHSELHNAELERQIILLEKAVLNSENTLLQRKHSINASLTALAQQLLQLQLPKETQKSLNGFQKSLHKKPAQADNLATLLQQLKTLQEHAMQAAAQYEQQPSQASTGLLRRLFKPTEPRHPAASQPQQDAEPETAADEHPPAETAAVEPSTLASSAQNSAAAQPKQDTDSAVLPLPSEINYNTLAEQIKTTLNTVLDDLPATSQHSQQVERFRSRINQGLQWYELAPLLDELFSFILDLNNGSERELEQYLVQLNRHLASFHNSLQTTSLGYRESITNTQALDSDLRQQVTHLQDDVQNSTDLAELKQQVDSRLNSFIDRLQSYQAQQELLNADLLERFQSLTEHAQHMEQEAQSLSTQLEEQRQKALHDSLTGLPNRTAWNERFALEHARLQRNGGSLTLGIIDLDHFKRVNDSYGHLAGDKVLKIIAIELKKRLRKTDFIARIGGEEYVILLPDTPLAEGYGVMEKLRLAVQDCPFHFKGEPVTVTFSAGVGEVSADETLTQAFERIDQTLYIAKNTGRNSVRLADAAPPFTAPHNDC